MTPFRGQLHHILDATRDLATQCMLNSSTLILRKRLAQTSNCNSGVLGSLICSHGQMNAWASLRLGSPHRASSLHHIMHEEASPDPTADASFLRWSEEHAKFPSLRRHANAGMSRKAPNMCWTTLAQTAFCPHGEANVAGLGSSFRHAGKPSLDDVDL